MQIRHKSPVPRSQTRVPRGCGNEDTHSWHVTSLSSVRCALDDWFVGTTLGRCLPCIDKRAALEKVFHRVLVGGTDGVPILIAWDWLFRCRNKNLDVGMWSLWRAEVRKLLDQGDFALVSC